MKSYWSSNGLSRGANGIWRWLAQSAGVATVLMAAAIPEAAAQTPTAGTDLSGRPVYLRRLSVLRYADSYTARIYTLTRVSLEVNGRGPCTDGWCPLTHNKVALFARRTHIDLTRPAGPIVTERTLRLGDDGDDVKAIQEVLVKKGAAIAVSGRYDAATSAAVRDFQRKNSLAVDGEVGPETRKRLVG